MGLLSTRPEPKPSRAEPPRKRRRTRARALDGFAWKHISFAAVAVCLAAFYLTEVAPGLVPVPPEVKVAFPALTEALGLACEWSGRNPEWVWGAGGVLLAVGTLLRGGMERYYIFLTVVVGFGLGVTYYSVSAPVDRLLRAVEENIPQDSRVPGAPSR